MLLSKQYSIKSLAVAFAAIAALLTFPRERSLRQQFALRRMGAEIGGGVGLDYQSVLSRLIFGNLDGDKASDLVFQDVALSDADAARLTLFPMVDHIRLHDCPDPERTIMVLHLARLNLSWLTITNARLHDLSSIAWFRGLGLLDLTNTNVSDDMLSPLGEVYYLSTLNLTGTQVRGPGLSSLQGLPHLKDLDLRGCPIDDSGLEFLKLGFPKLKYLQLQRTKVSREGIMGLQEALPNCQIESDFGDIAWFCL